MTLQELSDKIGVDPIDLVGDEEEAEYWLHEDISGTIFYQDLLAQMPDDLK